MSSKRYLLVLQWTDSFVVESIHGTRHCGQKLDVLMLQGRGQIFMGDKGVKIQTNITD